MTHSPTPEELTALRVAEAALLTADSSYGFASVIVFALGAAQLLQSPETAAELARLRVRVAELEAEHNRPAPVLYRDRYGDTRQAQDETLTLAATAAGGPVTGRPWVEPQGDVARDFGPLVPLEDPHDSPLHHKYDKGRDLPEMPHA